MAHFKLAGNNIETCEGITQDILGWSPLRNCSAKTYQATTSQHPSTQHHNNSVASTTTPVTNNPKADRGEHNVVGGAAAASVQGTNRLAAITI